MVRLFNIFIWIPLNKISARDNKNASSTGKYWLLKVFEILKNYQDDIILDGAIVFDETFFTVVESKRTYKDGNKLRGISRDKICIAVAYDGFRTIILSKNVSKPSSKSPQYFCRNTVGSGEACGLEQ